MKPSERDELLGRLDERTINTYKLVEQNNKHLANLNGSILDHEGRISCLEVPTPAPTKRKIISRPNVERGGTIALLLTIIYLLITNAG
jgi:hypothetical protein